MLVRILADDHHVHGDLGAFGLGFDRGHGLVDAEEALVRVHSGHGVENGLVCFLILAGLLEEFGKRRHCQSLDSQEPAPFLPLGYDAVPQEDQFVLGDFEKRAGCQKGPDQGRTIQVRGDADVRDTVRQMKIVNELHSSVVVWVYVQMRLFMILSSLEADLRHSPVAEQGRGHFVVVGGKVLAFQFAQTRRRGVAGLEKDLAIEVGINRGQGQASHLGQQTAGEGFLRRQSSDMVGPRLGGDPLSQGVRPVAVVVKLAAGPVAVLRNQRKAEGEIADHAGAEMRDGIADGHDRPGPPQAGRVGQFQDAPRQGRIRLQDLSNGLGRRIFGFDQAQDGQGHPVG